VVRPLGGVEAKIRRANEHARELATAIEEFGRSDFYEIATELDYRKRIVGRTVNVKTPGPDLGVLIGDCIHCLRSALDHLAYQLALSNTNPLPEAWAKDSSFPIFKTHTRFRGGKGNGRGAAYKMAGMSRSARASIKRLQPYHRRKHRMLRALWQLEELSNIDKHRLLPTVGAIPQRASFNIEFNQPGVKLAGLTPFAGPIEEGRRVVMVHGGPFQSPTDLGINADFISDVAFDQRCEAVSVRGFPVQAVLGGVFAALGMHVFPELNPELHRRFGVTFSLTPGD
jgi:hypothetical protein